MWLPLLLLHIQIVLCKVRGALWGDTVPGAWRLLLGQSFESLRHPLIVYPPRLGAIAGMFGARLSQASSAMAGMSAA
jgi:hypothetical protein